MSLGHGDHGCVGSTQRQVLVASHKFGGAPVVIAGELNGRQCPVGQRGQELRLNLCAALAGEQLADFGYYSARDENAALGQVQCGEEVYAFAMARIVLDCGGDEWPGVANDHGQRPKPSASNSSTCTEISVRPDVTAPNHGGGHVVPSAVLASRCTSASAADTCSSGS